MPIGKSLSRGARKRAVAREHSCRLRFERSIEASVKNASEIAFRGAYFLHIAVLYALENGLMCPPIDQTLFRQACRRVLPNALDVNSEIPDNTFFGHCLHLFTLHFLDTMPIDERGLQWRVLRPMLDSIGASFCTNFRVTIDEHIRKRVEMCFKRIFYKIEFKNKGTKKRLITFLLNSVFEKTQPLLSRKSSLKLMLSGQCNWP